MILEIALRTSAVLAAGLAFRAVLAGQSAALRHIVLVVTLACAVVVVPASFALPSWTVITAAAAPPSATTPYTPHAPVAPTTPATGFDAPPRRLPIAAALWTCGFLAVAGTLVAGLLRLRQIAARGRPVAAPRWSEIARAVGATYGLHRDVVLLEGTSPFVVATWGMRPARVLLPTGASSWSDARIRAVLAHELAHVARADWAIQIAAQIVLAALWFHPLAWFTCRLLRCDSEQACDDAVLRCGMDAPEYAGHLVALARICRRPAWSAWMPALPMARPSAFERRIAVMLNPRIDHRPLSLGAAATLAAVLVVVSTAVATARAGQASPATLSGTVYDPSGAVIPGVTLTLSTGGGWSTIAANGQALTVTQPEQTRVQATTDSAGHYSFEGVAAGRYVLSAQLPGFQQLHEEFDLKAAADWDRAVTLQVGTLRETINVSATRTFGATTAGGPAPIRVGGNIRVPLKLADVRPVYPESMRAEGREANVELEATIARDGSVSAVHVVSAQIHPDFAIAAIDAVRQWRFSPTLLNGKPIEVVMTVTVRFSLND